MSSPVPAEGRTVTGSSPHDSDLPHQPSWTDANSPTDLARTARMFFPRRGFTKTCIEVSTKPNQDNGAQLAKILEALGSNKDMLTTGQNSILQAIINIPTNNSTCTCDLSALEEGQMQILTEIGNLNFDPSLLDGILAAIAIAKGVIIFGQKGINNNIDNLESALLTVKTMILTGQGDINNNIGSLSNDLSTTKTMILNGQINITTDIDSLSSELSAAKDMISSVIDDLSTEVSTQINTTKTMILDRQDNIITDISSLSTQLETTETTILSELTTIHTKLDGLEEDQEKICNKIEALEAKIDTIIDKLMGGGGGGGGGGKCPYGYTLNNGLCYKLFTKKLNFLDATTVCSDEGGALATMTANNQDLLYSLADMAPSDRAWIGLSRGRRSWEWQDGSTYGDFLDWQGEEPNNRRRQCAVAKSTEDDGRLTAMTTDNLLPSTTESFRASGDSTLASAAERQPKEVKMNSDHPGEWVDRRCEREEYFICQIDADGHTGGSEVWSKISEECGHCPWSAWQMECKKKETLAVNLLQSCFLWLFRLLWNVLWSLAWGNHAWEDSYSSKCNVQLTNYEFWL